jgi:hypothetical protein
MQDQDITSLDSLYTRLDELQRDIGSVEFFFKQGSIEPPARPQFKSKRGHSITEDLLAEIDLLQGHLSAIRVKLPDIGKAKAKEAAAIAKVKPVAVGPSLAERLAAIADPVEHTKFYRENRHALIVERGAPQKTFQPQRGNKDYLPS